MSSKHAKGNPNVWGKTDYCGSSYLTMAERWTMIRKINLKTLIPKRYAVKFCVVQDHITPVGFE